MTPPGCLAHQVGRPGAHRLVGKHFPAPEQLDRSEVSGRSLVGHVEGSEPVDLVAEEIDPHRCLLGRGEDVDDAATYRQFAAVFDDRLAPVAPEDEAFDQFVHGHAVALADDDRLGGGPPGTESLKDGPDRCDHDRGSLPTCAVVGRVARNLAGCWVAEAPEQTEASAHGRDIRAHPLEGKGLPGGEDLDDRRSARVFAPVVAEAGLEELGEVVGQLIGDRPGGGDHEHRRAGAESGDTGQDEGLGRGGRREGRSGRADHLGHRRFVAQEGRERAEAHQARVPAASRTSGGLTEAGAAPN